MELKDRLRELRKARGITQETAAEALGVSSQTISKWERGLRAPDISLLPRIALLYNCTIDHLFGMDTIAASRTPMQEETLRSLMKSENYSAMLNLLLTECEAHSNNFQFLCHTLHFASRHNLYDHPELPRILPLIAHCENHCADQDLFHTILSYGLILSGQSSIPTLHAKTLEFYHKLPNQFAARERFVLFVMQGDELKQNILQNVWSYFEDAFKFLHHLAENAETIEEQMHLHQQRADIYEILSEGKYCGLFDGFYLNSYHKLAWKNMQLGNYEEAEACVDTILQRLRLHLSPESRANPAALFQPCPPGIESKSALPLLRRMERHPDLAPFRKKIKAFREEYESGIQEFKEGNPNA